MRSPFDRSAHALEHEPIREQEYFSEPINQPAENLELDASENKRIDRIAEPAKL
jgi:hypothetical protein